MVNQGLVMGLLVLASVMSGCSSKGDGEDIPTDDGTIQPTHDETTGAIHGVVFNDEAMPVSNAQVGVRDHPELDVQITTERGEFGFNNLSPDTYTVQISAIGFEFATQEFVVAMGGTTSQEITLVRLPSNDPFRDPKIQDGRIFASAGYTIAGCPAGAITCNSWAVDPDGDGPEYPQHHFWQVNDSARLPLETIIAELDWPVQSSACKSDMLFDLLAPGLYADGGVDYSDPRFFPADTFAPPIQIRVERAELVARGLVAEDGSSQLTGEWATRVFARAGGATGDNTADAGCSYEQPFTAYVTAFYGNPAEPGFTAVPEA